MNFLKSIQKIKLLINILLINNLIYVNQNLKKVINSDKNDNMFRYFERYQIKYELYFKFLDVISNDDPKNVLLSSYIEEIFVDVLSKIPYF